MPDTPFEQRKITDMSKQEAEGASFIPIRKHSAEDCCWGNGSCHIGMPDNDCPRCREILTARAELPTDEEIIASLIPQWPPHC